MNTLNKKQVNYLKEKISYRSNLAASADLVDFFDLFFVCEVTAKKLIEYYQKANNLKLSSENQSYSITCVKAAVKYFTLNINEATLQNIFKSGDGKRNSKTCRQLRNSYVHSLLEEDKAEIENRIAELKTYMETWINLFEIRFTKRQSH